jgi:hypothetical protein
MGNSHSDRTSTSAALDDKEADAIGSRVATAVPVLI